jgi:methanogenic corrinoid protein MtbC1
MQAAAPAKPQRLYAVAADAERSVPALFESDNLLPIARAEKDGSDRAQPAMVERLALTLTREVIPRLAMAHRNAGLAAAAHVAQVAPSARDVEAFAARVIDGSEAGIISMVEKLRRRGASAEMIYTGLITPVARLLGEMWCSDQCDFVTVTLGVARLQRLMRALSPSFVASAPLLAQPRTALLSQARDEQHGLGLAMVAEFFRRDGWAVECEVGPDAGDPAQRVQAQWFDVVGFSVGSENRLPWLRAQISGVRLASRNAAVVVMVGGPLFNAHPQWVDHVGADLWAADATLAPSLAAQRLQQLQSLEVKA